MDGDSIGILVFAGVVFGSMTAGVLWARAKGQVRRKAVLAMTQALGFQTLKDNHPPEYFPLKSFPVMIWGVKSTRVFSLAATGTRRGREVLFFDYLLWMSNGKVINTIVFQTFIAVHGGPECFEAITDPTLMLESAEGWTIAYWDKKILPAEEIQSIVLGIPVKA